MCKIEIPLTSCVFFPEWAQAQGSLLVVRAFRLYTQAMSLRSRQIVTARKQCFVGGTCRKIVFLKHDYDFRSPLGLRNDTIIITVLASSGAKTLEGLSFFEFDGFAWRKGPYIYIYIYIYSSHLHIYNLTAVHIYVYI